MGWRPSSLHSRMKAVSHERGERGGLPEHLLPSLASATRARECLLLSQAHHVHVPRGLRPHIPLRQLTARRRTRHVGLAASCSRVLVSTGQVGLSRPRSLETPVGLMTRRPQPARSTSESETALSPPAPPLAPCSALANKRERGRVALRNYRTLYFLMPSPLGEKPTFSFQSPEVVSTAENAPCSAQPNAR